MPQSAWFGCGWHHPANRDTWSVELELPNRLAASGGNLRLQDGRRHSFYVLVWLRGRTEVVPAKRMRQRLELAVRIRAAGLVQRRRTAPYNWDSAR